jgi:uncharacterized glyoxalase superfamily protein PhnB
MLRNRSMPASTVIPVLGYPDVSQAVDWLCNAFGFTLRLRIGDHRAQLNVGDGAVVVRGQQAKDPRECQSVVVRVNDVDAHHKRALQSGARVLHAPATHAYGERQYSVEDCDGNQWTFSQSVSDVDPKEWGGTAGAL